MGNKLTLFLVEQWITTVATGEFHYKQVLEGDIEADAYPKLREYISRCCEKGICESLGRRDGWYRPIQELPTPVNWQGANAQKDFPVILPFGLRKYIWVDPETTSMVAGSKDSGKTLMLMKIVVLNMRNPEFKVIFLTNMEEGVNQLKRRFEYMGVPNPAPFLTYQIIDNFHDAIKEANTLYVIDYIDVPESGEFYMIAPAVAKIQVRLVGLNSVAIIGLQKKMGSDWAYGGQQTLKKATFYLAMDVGKLKIISAKIPADPKILPKNMQWSFGYNETGSDFTNIERYYGE